MIDKAGLKVVLFPRAKYTVARGLVVIKPVKKKTCYFYSLVEKGFRPYKMIKAGRNIVGTGSDIRISSKIDIFWLLKRYVLKKKKYWNKGQRTVNKPPIYFAAQHVLKIKKKLLLGKKGKP